MSTSWIASFLLLLLIVLAESILLLSLMRQVGVLSMRVRPLGAMEGDEETGPTADTVLAEVALQEVPGQARDGPPFERELSVLMFVSPTCSLCKSLLKPAAAVAKDHPNLALFLVSEVAVERAAEYARRMSTKLPFLTAPNLFDIWGIKGTPFVAVVGSDRRVVRSGVVNTLEQLEVLVEIAVTDRLGSGANALRPAEPDPVAALE